MNRKFIFNQILLITTSFLAFGMEDPNPKHVSHGKRKKEELTIINNLDFKKFKIDEEEEEETEECNVDKIETQASFKEEEENNFQNNHENNLETLAMPLHLMPLLLSFMQNLSSLDGFSDQQSIKLLNASNNQVQSIRDSYLCGKNINRLPSELIARVLNFVIFEKTASLCKKFDKLELGNIEIKDIPSMLNCTIDSIFGKLTQFMKSFEHTRIPADIISLENWDNIASKQIIKHLSSWFLYHFGNDALKFLKHIRHFLQFKDDMDGYDNFTSHLFIGCINSYNGDFTALSSIEGIHEKDCFDYLIAFALENDLKRVVKLLIERKALQILIDKGLTFFKVFGFRDPYDFDIYSQDIVRKHQKLIKKNSDEFKKSKAKS